MGSVVNAADELRNKRALPDSGLTPNDNDLATVRRDIGDDGFEDGELRLAFKEHR